MSDQLFQKKKMREKAELARRQTSKSGELVRVICEGKRTEINYFTGFAKTYRLTNIEAIHSELGTDPVSIVEYELQFGEDHPEIDQIFCVFDHDGREQ